MDATPAEEKMPQRQLALVLAGGGARTAYQAGVVSAMREQCPEVSYPILTGVSSGAINAAFLAGHPCLEGAQDLERYWRNICQERVYQAESAVSLLRRVLPRVPSRNAMFRVQEGEAILNMQPHRRYLAQQLPAAPDGSLPQIRKNLQSAELKSFCVTTTNYSTGQSVSWVQGHNLQTWDRPNRISYRSEITLDHIMASSAMPLLFPAVKIGQTWHGDGGVRLKAPLSPALHLGATDIICISPQYQRTESEASMLNVKGYPPAAQVMGIILDATFLDAFDHDVRMAGVMTRLAKHSSDGDQGRVRSVNTLLIEPSRDIALLAKGLESKTKGVLRMITRGLGSGDTMSPEWLSIMLFDPEFIRRVLELGYEDGRQKTSEIEAFMEQALHG